MTKILRLEERELPMLLPSGKREGGLKRQWLSPRLLAVVCLPVHKGNNAAYVWISCFNYWNFIAQWLKFCLLMSGLIQERLGFHCPTGLGRPLYLFFCPLFALSTLAPSFVINSVQNGKRRFWRCCLWKEPVEHLSQRQQIWRLDFSYQWREQMRTILHCKDI